MRRCACSALLYVALCCSVAACVAHSVNAESGIHCDAAPGPRPILPLGPTLPYPGATGNQARFQKRHYHAAYTRQGIAGAILVKRVEGWGGAGTISPICPNNSHDSIELCEPFASAIPVSACACACNGTSAGAVHSGNANAAAVATE